jgi:hypothetical protein
MTDTKSKPEKPPFPTRNYLTLIIVLIVLICATLGLALGLAAPHLDAFQKWFLILILIFFPFFSIAVVAWLILRHSNKLAVGRLDESLDWETTSAEKQKRKLNGEVRELAKDLDIPVEQLSDLRSAYIVAEDLALRKIQEEAASPLMRKINIGNTDFDAVFTENDLVTCIEITFVVTGDILQDKINLYLRKTAAAKNFLTKTRKGSRVRLLLVLVTQADQATLDELRTNVRNRFKPELTPVSVDIRFLDFQTLQKIYAED